MAGLPLIVLLPACAHRLHSDPASRAAEDRAVAFLQREVPAWSRDNGCFSCHNNGDAARALYAASTRGHRIPKDVLAGTTQWVVRPQNWDDNKGDPGFSDQRLADVQFTAALAAALTAGASKDRRALNVAAKRVARGQADDGAWPVDIANPAGSPATYGLPLATYMAWNALKQATLPEAMAARRKAEDRLQAIPPDSVPNAAVLIWFDPKSPQAATAIDLLRRAQTTDGGWGPYADSPPEAFDTSLALLALAAVRSKSGVPQMIERGRQFLAAAQLADGSWPATTRPSGGESYAQQISTTGWATLALLATR